MKNKTENQKPQASVALQILFFWDMSLSIPYYQMMLYSFFLKRFAQVYPSIRYETEFWILLIFIVINFWKIKVGSSGNINESAITLVGFLALEILCIIFLIVFLYLQTYILRAEWWGSLIMIMINTFEFIWGIFITCSFSGNA